MCVKWMPRYIIYRGGDPREERGGIIGVRYISIESKRGMKVYGCEINKKSQRNHVCAHQRYRVAGLLECERGQVQFVCGRET